jgi:hypothetical protein
VNAAVALYAANCSRFLPSINLPGNGANTAHRARAATSTRTAPEFARPGIADGEFGRGSGRSGIHCDLRSYSTQTFQPINVDGVRKWIVLPDEEVEFNRFQKVAKAVEIQATCWQCGKN